MGQVAAFHVKYLHTVPDLELNLSKWQQMLLLLILLLLLLLLLLLRCHLEEAPLLEVDKAN